MRDRPPLSALTADRGAEFAELYSEHAAHVHRFCLSQVADGAAAEDLTHETFLRAFAVEGRGLSNPADLRPWLITVARHLCVDHHRRHVRMRTLLSRLRSISAAPAGVEMVAEGRARLQQVQAELQRLRRRERELIGLRVAADLSYCDIGALLGISEDAAKVATHRALTRLRDRLQEAP